MHYLNVWYLFMYQPLYLPYTILMCNIFLCISPYTYHTIFKCVIYFYASALLLTIHYFNVWYIFMYQPFYLPYNILMCYIFLCISPYTYHTIFACVIFSTAAMILSCTSTTIRTWWIAWCYNWEKKVIDEAPLFFLNKY